MPKNDPNNDGARLRWLRKAVVKAIGLAQHLAFELDDGGGCEDTNRLQEQASTISAHLQGSLLSLDDGRWAEPDKLAKLETAPAKSSQQQRMARLRNGESEGKP